MWYAVETAFIKGCQYKSRLMFDPKAISPGTCYAYPGTCLQGYSEEPMNSCETFMDGEIEIHVDWFQTMDQAIKFRNGSLVYVKHVEVWYDRPIRSVRSKFLKWEAVPAKGEYLPYRGYRELHYREGKEKMLNDLLMALLNAKTEKDKETAYRNLQSVGMDRATANMLASELKKERGQQ